MMKFSKAKMMARIEKEGKMDMVDEASLKIMDDCDGQEVHPSCWNRVVYDEPVFFCIGKSGKKVYVYEGDCE